MARCIKSRAGFLLCGSTFDLVVFVSVYTAPVYLSTTQSQMGILCRARLHLACTLSRWWRPSLTKLKRSGSEHWARSQKLSVDSLPLHSCHINNNDDNNARNALLEAARSLWPAPVRVNTRWRHEHSDKLLNTFSRDRVERLETFMFAKLWHFLMVLIMQIVFVLVFERFKLASWNGGIVLFAIERSRWVVVFFPVKCK